MFTSGVKIEKKISANKNNTAVLILGAPRSGTSVTTGLLQMLGMNLGNQLSSPQSWNPKGDFEDKSTIEINKKIVRILNIRSPLYKEIIDLDWSSPKAQECKEIIKSNLLANFGHLSSFGIKHPRVCLLLPLYLQALQELSYTPKLIFVIRNPNEILASLKSSVKQDDGITSDEEGLTFINNFLTSAEIHAGNCKKIYVTFDEVLNYPEQLTDKINKFLPELGLKTFSQVQDQITKFITPEFKHHACTVSQSFFKKIKISQNILSLELDKQKKFLV